MGDVTHIGFGPATRKAMEALSAAVHDLGRKYGDNPELLDLKMTEVAAILEQLRGAPPVEVLAEAIAASRTDPDSAIGLAYGAGIAHTQRVLWEHLPALLTSMLAPMGPRKR